MSTYMDPPQWLMCDFKTITNSMTAENNDSWRQLCPVMEGNNILYCKVWLAISKSEFHTKAMQQCTNIYNSCFEVMHILTLFSVGIMSNVSGICGGYEKDPQKYWLNLLMLSENDTKRERKPANSSVTSFISSPLWAALNKFNDAHWGKGMSGLQQWLVWWFRAPPIPVKRRK